MRVLLKVQWRTLKPHAYRLLATRVVLSAREVGLIEAKYPGTMGNRVQEENAEKWLLFGLNEVLKNRYMEVPAEIPFPGMARAEALVAGGREVEVPLDPDGMLFPPPHGESSMLFAERTFAESEGQADLFPRTYYGDRG